jgi:hypothetical protein
MLGIEEMPTCHEHKAAVGDIFVDACKVPTSSFEVAPAILIGLTCRR